MNEWEKFKRTLVFMKNYEPVRIEEQFTQSKDIFHPSDEFQGKYPKLTALLFDARVARLTTARGERFLFSWLDNFGHQLAWLAYPPGLIGKCPASDELVHDHRLLLTYFGGVDQDCYVEDSVSTTAQADLNNLWTNNLRFWAAEQRCKLGIDGWETCWEYAQKNDPFENPIRVDDYVTFAEYADGGSIAYRKSDATIVLFTSDNCFDKTSSFENCPRWLYTFDEAPKFRDWVEKVSEKWTVLRSDVVAN
jgi:hypothetical protein